MDNWWVLAWVLVTMNTSKGNLSYSEPVKTLEDCQRIQTFVNTRGWNESKCVQVTVQRKVSAL
jgi:hypothetical protein